MPVTISDEMLAAAGLSEQEAKLEIACRLYASTKLTMPEATRWAGVSRTVFEQALVERNLPIIRAHDGYWEQEQKALAQLGW
jgi:predicted HTH domain antitoxin